MVDRTRVAAALEALPPRVWGLVLREVRTRLADGATGADGLRELLAGPRSALASGPGRTRAAALLADDGELRAALRAVPALADAVAALGADATGATGATVTPADDATATGAAASSDGPSTDARDLRAELARARRQRDGAEARARAAEGRAASLAAEAETLRERSAAAEADLAGAAEERARAVERAERRATERLRDVESELSELRSVRERLTRELDQERRRAARLRAELEEARAAVPTPATPPPRRDRPVGLPPGTAPDTTEAARHLLAAVDLVVVDGYNLTLRARAGLDLAGQRRWLLDRLRPVAARGLRVVVAFDGDRGAGTRRDDGGVEVVFTPERIIADDEIEFIAGEAAEGGVPTLVVTDDAELRRRVAVHDADVVGVLPFVGALG